MEFFTPLLPGFITYIQSVFEVVNEDSTQAESLRTSLIHARQIVNKALAYQSLNSGCDPAIGEVTISLIQLLYNAENILLDRQSSNVTYNLSRYAQILSQGLGFSSNNNPSTVKQNLDAMLAKWPNIIQEWERSTSPIDNGMTFEEKKCFAYFLLFPNEYEFNINDLVHLWIGERYFERNGATEPHWESYVDKLKDKDVLQPLDDSGLLFKFNNSYQDQAKLFAAETCQHLDRSSPILNDKTRHLSLSCAINCSDLQTPKNLKLRTLLSLYTEEECGFLQEILSKLEQSLSLLRVLSLRYARLRNLQPSKHEFLRFLDISFATLEDLPINLPISYPALHFLKMKNSSLYNGSLPLKEFQKLTGLRYVDWDEDYLRAKEVPRHIGKLIHLETLPLFQVGTEDGCFISELNNLNNLQGSIRIENLEHVYANPVPADRDAAEKAMRAAKEARLDAKSGLRTIKLHWKSDDKRDSACDEHILKGLNPHENVKELKIEGYRGNDLPVWIRDSNIEEVGLKECRKCYLPALGIMKKLKTLVLENMRSIKDVTSAGDAYTVGCFPELESLEFHNMTDLEEWTGVESRGLLPRLKELKFQGCTKIDSSLPFIKFLMEFRPFMKISNDSECIRCYGRGRTCDSSVACSN